MKQPEKKYPKDLALYRLEVSKDDLRIAKMLFEQRDFRVANNRAYYSIYHAISAVHALNEKAYKRHKEAIANFNKEFISTEIFPKKLGRRIAEAEEIRHASDYDDFFIATKDEAEEQIETAEELLKLIEKYIKKRIDED